MRREMVVGRRSRHCSTLTETITRAPPIKVSDLPEVDVELARAMWKNVKDSMDKEPECYAFTDRISLAWEEQKSLIPTYIDLSTVENSKKSWLLRSFLSLLCKHVSASGGDVSHGDGAASSAGRARPPSLLGPSEAVLWADACGPASSAAVTEHVAVEETQLSPLRCKRKRVHEEENDIEYVSMESVHGKIVDLSKKLALVAYVLQ